MENHKPLGSSVQLERSLWDFALQAYANDDLEHQSLQLQDEFNANVNIILWCCWLEVEDIHLSADWLDDVLITIDSVSLQTVSKLRAVRKMLKESGSFTKVQALSIKKHILNAEMMIEKVLLQRLQDLTCRFLESKDYKNFAKEGKKLNLEYYLEFIGVADARKSAGLMLNTCRRNTLQSAV